MEGAEESSEDEEEKEARQAELTSIRNRMQRNPFHDPNRYTVKSQKMIYLRKVDPWSELASRFIWRYTGCLCLIVEIIRLHENSMQPVNVIFILRPARSMNPISWGKKSSDFLKCRPVKPDFAKCRPLSKETETLLHPLYLIFQTFDFNFLRC